MIRARLQHIERVLGRDEKETRHWWRTWICIQGALFVGNGAWGIATFDDRGARAEHFLNAAGSLVGGLSLLVLRPPALRASRDLRELPDDTFEQRTVKVEVAETLLTKNAEAQKLGTGLVPYAGTLLVGSAIALPMWLKYDRKVGAASSLLGGLVLTTLEVVTLPTASLKDQEEHTQAPTMPPFDGTISVVPSDPQESRDEQTAAQASRARALPVPSEPGLTWSITSGGLNLMISGAWR